MPRIPLATTATLAATAAAHAQLTAQDTLAAYQAATSGWTATLQNFDGLGTPGPIPITSLPGITSVTSVDRFGAAAPVEVRADSSIPFPMFQAPTQSQPNFMSITMIPPTYATGIITLDFALPQNGLGFFVMDSSPLDTFRIDLYNGANSVGSVSSATPRNKQFFGVTSVAPFTRAVLTSNSTFDSWGLDDLRWASTAAACYANCDGSTAPPVLNVNDFNCFLNRFAAGDSYANCDASTAPPVLNVNDFNCFLNRFAAGCD